MHKKNVIIYGTGKNFQEYLERGIFAKYNVLGVCDKKYFLEQEGQFDFGFKIIPLENLTAYKADYIIVAVQRYKPIIKMLKSLKLQSKIIPVERKFSFEWFTPKSNTFILIKSNGKVVKNPRIKNLRVKFHGKNNYIEIHEPIEVTDSVYISCSNNSKITIGPFCKFKKAGFYMENNNTLNIGRYNTMEDVTVSMRGSGNNKIKIGSNCMFSYGVFLRTSDVHAIYTLSDKKQINLSKDIEIQDHVWIASDCKILKGSIIPSNCVIGTTSVVTKEFMEKNCIIAGNPAVVRKTGINWRREPFI